MTTTPITDAIRAYSEGSLSLDDALSAIVAHGHVPYSANPDGLWAWDGGDGKLDSFGQMQLAFFQLSLTADEKRTFRALIQSLAQGGSTVQAHLPGQHDQRNHGRKRGGRLLAEVAKDEGFTYQPIATNVPTSGYAVCPYPERELVVDANDLSRQTINDYLDKHASFVEADPDRHVGGWGHKKASLVYLDVVVVKETPSEALAIAIEFNQLAYFDLSNGEEVTTNG